LISYLLIILLNLILYLILDMLYKIEIWRIRGELGELDIGDIPSKEIKLSLNQLIKGLPRRA
jgi:hypothetical protein